MHLFVTALGIFAEGLRCIKVTFRSRASLIAENVFLRKQLAFYRERNIKPLRLTDSARFTLLFWARWFNWRNALVIVKPETFIGRHRRAFRFFWQWMTFVRNHARAIVACDFVVAVTLHFRILYIFVVMEVGSRKLLHVNATPFPTSSWTLQQLREAIPGDRRYRWLIYDRSGIFSEDLDRSLTIYQAFSQIACFRIVLRRVLQ